MVVSRQFCFEMCLVWLNHLDGVAGPPMWSIPGNSGFEICLVWLNHLDGAADPRLSAAAVLAQAVGVVTQRVVPIHKIHLHAGLAVRIKISLSLLQDTYRSRISCTHINTSYLDCKIHFYAGLPVRILIPLIFIVRYQDKRLQAIKK